MQSYSKSLEAQSELAYFCRSGDTSKLQDLDQARAQIYRGLIYNIIENSLVNAFPIAHAELSQVEWQLLVNDFLREHKAKSALLWLMPKEFKEFVKRMGYAQKIKKPYLDNLLEFEWLEIEVYMMPDQPRPNFKLHGNSNSDLIIVNPEFKTLQLEYPVYKRLKSEFYQTPARYDLVCFRHPETMKVCFVEVSEIFVSILERLKSGPITLNGLTSHVVDRFGAQVADKALKESILAFIAEMITQRLILGYLEEK